MTNHKKQIIFGVAIILLLVSVPVSSLAHPTFIKQKMKINPYAISFSDATQTASLTIKQYGKTATHTIQDHTLIYDDTYQNIITFLFIMRANEPTREIQIQSFAESYGLNTTESLPFE